MSVGFNKIQNKKAQEMMHTLALQKMQCQHYNVSAMETKSQEFMLIKQNVQDSAK